MKAISLKPPWPWAIFNGKDIENRPWSTSYRGPILIHASKGWDQDGYEFLVNEMGLAVPVRKEHVFGTIVGSVNLIDCISANSSKWFFGPWGFVLRNPKKLRVPVPWKGRLGLFEVGDRAVVGMG